MRLPNLAEPGPVCASVTLVFALALLTVCGGSDGSGGSLDMLPGDITEVAIYDLESIDKNEQLQDFADERVQDWETSYGAIGILVDEVETVTLARSRGGVYVILKGEFDFEYIRDDLDDGDYDDEEFRGYEVWSGGRVDAIPALALMEDDGLVLVGEDNTILDILRNLADDTGSGDDDTGDVLRAVRRAGEGLVVFGGSPCAQQLRGCEAFAGSFTTGDRYEVRFTGSLLFRNGERAEAESEDVEKLFERSGYMETRSVTTDDEFVILEGILDVDDLDGALTWIPNTLSE